MLFYISHLLYTSLQIGPGPLCLPIQQAKIEHLLVIEGSSKRRSRKDKVAFSFLPRRLYDDLRSESLIDVLTT